MAEARAMMHWISRRTGDRARSTRMALLLGVMVCALASTAERARAEETARNERLEHYGEASALAGLCHEEGGIDPSALAGLAQEDLEQFRRAAGRYYRANEKLTTAQACKEARRKYGPKGTVIRNLVRF